LPDQSLQHADIYLFKQLFVDYTIRFTHILESIVYDNNTLREALIDCFKNDESLVPYLSKLLRYSDLNNQNFIYLNSFISLL